MAKSNENNVLDSKVKVKPENEANGDLNAFWRLGPAVSFNQTGHGNTEPMIYLDYNATAPIKPAVRAAVLEAMERHGNPSSMHRYGRSVRRYNEEARASVAALVGVKPAQVIFTGGGTEANNMILRAQNYPAILTSAIEHDSVLASTPSALRLPVTTDGVIDLERAQAMIKAAPKGALLSVMLVNNETGVIQPIEKLARMAQEAGLLMHADAIQAAGRLPLDFAGLGIDFLSLSAHKIGGPQGIGAVIAAENKPLASFIKGGGQEMNRRAGTENNAGIAGFGIAALLAADDLREVPRLTALRDGLQKELTAIGRDDAVVIGANAPRVANTLCIALKNIASETQVMAMDLAGVAVSSGSACSSGKVKASHVLKAMGYSPEVAGSAMRISLGWATETGDIARCITAWQNFYTRIRDGRERAPSQSQAA